MGTVTEVAEGGRRAATTHLAMESRARRQEAAAVTTTVEQRMSDNRVTGHHAWDRVCEQRGGQTQPTDRIGMHAGRVEWSRAAEWSGVEQPSGVESSSRVEQ